MNTLRRDSEVRVESDLEDDDTFARRAGFKPARDFRDKLAKKAAEKVTDDAQKKRFNARKSVWGKGDNGGSMTGSVPSIFLHNLRNDVTAEVVKEELMKRKVNVTNVTKKSHENAYKCSFLVEVSDRASFDLIMSGDVLPSDVGARQWRQKRYNGEQKQGSEWPSSQ